LLDGTQDSGEIKDERMGVFQTLRRWVDDEGSLDGSGVSGQLVLVLYMQAA
jgi:hypothetical protein